MKASESVTGRKCGCQTRPSSIPPSRTINAEARDPDRNHQALEREDARHGMTSFRGETSERTQGYDYCKGSVEISQLSASAARIRMLSMGHVGAEGHWQN